MNEKNGRKKKSLNAADKVPANDKFPQADKFAQTVEA